MNAKDLVKNALRGRKSSRPPLIPFVGSYLTRVDQYSMEEICHNGGLLHQALRNTQQLLNYDGVVMPLEPTLEAEAFGLSVKWDKGNSVIVKNYSLDEVPSFDPETWMEQGRLPIFIEAAKRFSQVEGKNTPFFATVSGPLTVWSELYGRQPETAEGVISIDIPNMETVVQAVLTLCRHYAEAGVDGIIVNEGDISFQNGDLSRLSSMYKPIFNVIRHFNLFGIFRAPRKIDSNSSPFATTGAEACILSSEQFAGRESMKGAIGVSLNQEFWSGDDDTKPMIGFASRHKSKGIFLTTDNPLNQEDIDLFELQEKIGEIKTEGYWND